MDLELPAMTEEEVAKLLLTLQETKQTLDPAVVKSFKALEGKGGAQVFKIIQEEEKK